MESAVGRFPELVLPQRLVECWGNRSCCLSTTQHIRQRNSDGAFSRPGLTDLVNQISLRPTDFSRLIDESCHVREWTELVTVFCWASTNSHILLVVVNKTVLISCFPCFYWFNFLIAQLTTLVSLLENDQDYFKPNQRSTMENLSLYRVEYLYLIYARITILERLKIKIVSFPHFKVSSCKRTFRTLPQLGNKAFLFYFTQFLIT